jgi:hypothetical protein
MKKITLLLLIISLNGYSQELKLDETGLYSAKGIEQYDSINKTILFQKVNEWITLNYKSANEVIQLTDKEQGKIIMKGIFDITASLVTFYVHHTVIFDFKDGKLRYNYTNITLENSNNSNNVFGLEDKNWMQNKFIKKIQEKININVSSLNNFIKNATIKRDDW